MNTTATKLVSLFKLSTAYGTNVFYSKKDMFQVGFLNSLHTSNLEEFVKTSFSDVHISIRDIKGKVWISESFDLNQEQNDISFENLPFGKYIFTLEFEKKQFARQMELGDHNSVLAA